MIARDKLITVYKQIPGADIEPGWYVILHRSDRDYPTLDDTRFGPYRYKRDANKTANDILRGII